MSFSELSRGRGPHAFVKDPDVRGLMKPELQKADLWVNYPRFQPSDPRLDLSMPPPPYTFPNIEEVHSGYAYAPCASSSSPLGSVDLVAPHIRQLPPVPADPALGERGHRGSAEAQKQRIELGGGEPVRRHPSYGGLVKHGIPVIGQQ